MIFDDIQKKIIVTKVDAILSLKNDAVVTVRNEKDIEWHDDNPTNITEEQINTEQQRLQNIEDSK
tara:strand:- start:59 stop:253 length:195 start_codon:yes stop_codon:yes gene_type:complete